MKQAFSTNTFVVLAAIDSGRFYDHISSANSSLLTAKHKSGLHHLGFTGN